METIGSGAVTAPFSACADSDVIIIIGANPTVNHPVAATFIKNATKRGAKLVVIDPRGQSLSRFATHNLRFRPGTDVALLNAILHVVVDEKLYDPEYVERFTDGFDQFAKSLKSCTPEAMAPLCGIDAETLRAVAVRNQSRGDDFLGHGDLATCSRNRQCSVPHRLGVALRTGWPTGGRAASVAWSKQRPGGFGRGVNPNVFAGLSSSRRQPVSV